MPLLLLKNARAFSILWSVLTLTLGCVAAGGFTAAHAAENVALPPQTVAPGKISLIINLELPAGYKLNQEAPSTLAIKAEDNRIIALDEKYARPLPLANLPLTLTVPAKEGKTTLQTTYRLNFCDDKLGICFFQDVTLTLPVEVNRDCANRKLEVSYKVKAN
jgi:hypothetical protein